MEKTFLFSDELSLQSQNEEYYQGGAWASFQSPDILHNDPTGFYYMGRLFARFALVLVLLMFIFEGFLIMRYEGVSSVFQDWRIVFLPVWGIVLLILYVTGGWFKYPLGLKLRIYIFLTAAALVSFGALMLYSLGKGGEDGNIPRWLVFVPLWVLDALLLVGAVWGIIISKYPSFSKGSIMDNPEARQLMWYLGMILLINFIFSTPLEILVELSMAGDASFSWFSTLTQIWIPLGGCFCACFIWGSVRVLMVRWKVKLGLLIALLGLLVLWLVFKIMLTLFLDSKWNVSVYAVGAPLAIFEVGVVAILLVIIVRTRNL